VRRACQGSQSFMKMPPKMTLKSGSSDLTTLTKAREPAPSDITVTHWPAPWMSATGSTDAASPPLSLGGLRRPKAYSGAVYRKRPMPSCTAEMSHGRFSTLSTVLLVSLYHTLSAYHKRKKKRTAGEQQHSHMHARLHDVRAPARRVPSDQRTLSG
jgi:hypothetical protein